MFVNCFQPYSHFLHFLKTLFASSIMRINCADKNTEIKYSLNVKIMSSFKEVYDKQYLNNNIIFFHARVVLCESHHAFKLKLLAC